MATKKNKQLTDAQLREEERIKNSVYADEFIPVMNICPMRLTLTTEPYGGKETNFGGFGDVKRISYGDLVLIMNSHPRFVEQGFYYIMDERVVKKHGLSEVYNTILTKEKIEKIIDMGDEALGLYRSANETQRNFINGILIRKLINEEDIDLNMVSKISKISGIDLVEKARETRDIMQGEEEK